jgi:hypothetical protein
MREILLLLCLPFVGIAQTDYELAFNSATLDYVEMTNASAVIANKTAFSMSCWVYPEANTNHGGIMGFRNNTDADFYLLQMQNTNTIEARFRNSSGIKFDVLGGNLLDIGQWQHLAFTYDGSYIRLYKNGIIVDSTAANGTITQTTQSFNLGMLDYQGSAFHLNGRLDEIRLWDVALSTNEIIGWICSPIYLFHPNYNNLMGYWRLNNGQGTIADDQSANGNNGTLMEGTQWQIATTCFGSNSQSLTYVPDDNFENYLEANGMGDGIALNDYVLSVNINLVTHLDLTLYAISDLTGIEDFTNLVFLECEYNPLPSLDVSNNLNLMYLGCSMNYLLTSLDLSNNLALTRLDFSATALTNIDLSNNTNLTSLDCGHANLTNLDVSNNTLLDSLNCGYLALPNINLSQNPDLTWLYCDGNSFTTIDLSANLDLVTLICRSNELTILDVNANTALAYLHCSGNQLTSLDVSANAALTTLSCFYNDFTSLDVSQNTLTYLDCSNNHLISLDVRNGNNNNMNVFSAINNPNLHCINVDDMAWSTANWTVVNNNIDVQQYFSNNCSAVVFDCTDSLEVTDVITDNANLTMNIAIYNGYNSYLSMPYVAFTIDANGDTIQQGNMNLFGAINLDTSWYNYSINSAINPSYPLTMYFVYAVSIGGSVTDTCILTYNSTPTAITDINPSSNRKLISIIDVLGRESKVTRNEPFIYIYDDGTVEKQIIIE